LAGVRRRMQIVREVLCISPDAIAKNAACDLYAASERRGPISVAY